MIKFRPVHIFIVFLLILSSWAQAASQYSHVYVFGDSLSDTGNLSSIIGLFPPPFYMNRVSNGPVAVEILANKLGLNADASLHLIGPAVGTNYAVAGANALGDEIIDLDSQVFLFMANHGHVAPADALYVMMIGGNDVRSARDDLDFNSAKNTVRAAVARVKLAIMALAQSGAHSFLVVNPANIGITPEAHLLAASLDEPKLIKRSRKLSQVFRVALHQALNDLSYTSDLQLIEFDLFKFFNKRVKQADRFGITNTTDACFNRDTFIFHVDCDSGLNFDQFFFFDDLHPTARVHMLLGDALYEALERTREKRR